MVMCFVPHCKHYSEQRICKFFVFPAKIEERKAWISLIRRQDKEPSKYSLVCSCHFVNNDRKNRPTIFEFNVKRKFGFTSPEKRKRSTRKQADVEDLALPLNPSFIDLDGDQSGPSNAEDLPSCSRTIRSSGASLEAENYCLTQDLKGIITKLEILSVRFSYEHIKDNDAHVLMYTGIPNNALFMVLDEFMANIELKYYANWQVEMFSKRDQLLMTLMKLKLNLPHEDLGLRFGCSPATVTNIIMTWIYALHEVLYKQLMKRIPSRSKNQACLPAAFDIFKNCRIILGCTEIYSARPGSMENQRLTYSSYRHRNTWKVLVGVAPNGVITYVSDAYPGSMSDKKLVEHCEILKQMVTGDLILADKSFLIKELLPTGVHLNIPPFLSTPQFTEAQVHETHRIAKARIHVDRAIRRIKCFNILQRIPQYYMSQISVIFQLSAALTNFQYPLIKEVEEYYS